IQGATVTVLGAAYLENADDTRNTPSATLIGALVAKGAKVILHDPHVIEWEFDQREIAKDLDAALKDSDCLALVTKHKEYLDLDLSHLKKIMRTPIIVDGRDVFDKDEVKSKGFEYRAIGKVGISR
ncbi:MAG: UDP binding domain-containing protein, partial [Candidatus Thorarchaeota archaeon]